MTFKDAIASCFMQYFSTEGRANRTEFWYFACFILICSFATYLIGLVLPDQVAPIVQALVFMVTAIPLFSVFVRRMHDLGGTGLRAFLLFVPILQFICFYWAAQKGEEGENMFGGVPE